MTITTGTLPAVLTAHPDLIPKILTIPSLNLLGGGSGVGKTALIAGLVRDFQAGLPIFGHQTTRPPKIAYIAADRPWSDAKQWFDAVGVTDIAVYSLIDDLSFKTSRLSQPKPGEHARIFEELLDRLDLPPGSLLIVDPIALFLGGDLNHYIRCAIGCINLYRIILQRQLCVIGLVHSSKQSADAKQRYGRLQDRLSGSMAQLGYSATQMYLAGPDEIGESHHAFVWNPHHAKAEVFKLKQDEKTGLFRPHGIDAVGTPLPTLPAHVLSTWMLLPEPPALFTVDQIHALYVDKVVDRVTVWRHFKVIEAHGLIRSLPGALKEWTRVIPDTTDVDPEGPDGNGDPDPTPDVDDGK